MSNDQLVGVIAILSMLLLASRSFRGLGVPRAHMIWMALALALASLPARALATVEATAEHNGHTLTIVGDREANHVEVVIDDASRAVKVSDDGVECGQVWGADRGGGEEGEAAF